MSTALHNAMKDNYLEKMTEKISGVIGARPTLYKVILLVNHVFRAAVMVSFMRHLPFSPLQNLAIGFAGSLFYRVTVEKNCAYKFALPAFAGALTFAMAQASLAQILNGVAFSNLKMFAHALGYTAPFMAYVAYVILTVDYDASPIL